MKDLYLNCRQDTFHHSSLGLYLINHSLIVEWKINERSPECTRAKERKKWKKARVLSYYYQVILCFPIIWMLRNENQRWWIITRMQECLWLQCRYCPGIPDESQIQESYWEERNAFDYSVDIDEPNEGNEDKHERYGRSASSINLYDLSVITMRLPLYISTTSWFSVSPEGNRLKSSRNNHRIVGSHAVFQSADNKRELKIC